MVAINEEAEASSSSSIKTEDELKDESAELPSEDIPLDASPEEHPIEPKEED